ncbi:hypothetical protein [Archangium sp.]|uniref:hypothetical protein n=1 Tax=Archangium sp. TaxID=1872627 RepID=UPI00286A357C|nr:hypothetical protein [Archangium sp.]
MNRRIIGLLATVCLASACKPEPVGEMEPIPRPPDMPAAPARAEAEKKPATAPAPDPSKVVLRWKLDAPTGFRLTTSSGSDETSALFVLRKRESGDYAFRIVPEKGGGEEDQGTMSERGFVLDGLSGPLHTTATLVLELPLEPVGPDAAWTLSPDLVDLSAVRNFVEKKTERRNQVKLTALTPGDNGEQVATLEYDLTETVSGELRGAPKAAAPPKDTGKKKGKDAKAEDAPAAASDKEQVTSSEVRVKARGEFLVKAGRWRSWEGTLTTQTQGELPGVSSGERKLRLTPLETVPQELLQPQAKK